MKTQEVIKSVKYSGATKIKFAVTDIDGVLRGKTISTEKFLKSLEEEKIGFCDVVFGWDMNDSVYDHSGVTGWHTGYPDAMASLDPATYRKIPWAEEIPFFLADFSSYNRLEPVCPRSLLKRVRREAVELGYTPRFSSEYEWFNFRETPQSLGEKDYANPIPITTGMFGYSMLRSSTNYAYFHELYDLLHKFDIPVESIHTETGPGVYEACIDHTDILQAADRSVLFKNSVKEIAYRHGIIASFMAKWNDDLPGCSGHIHQSLWDKSDETNLFYDASAENNSSPLLKHYIAGQLHCLPYIVPMYAPTVNSYKRFVAGSWAATTSSWGVENRTAALRVIAHSQASARLETRVPGADSNPYLAMAASLASGIYGIKKKLTLDIPATAGNEYENEGNRPLPCTLQQATEEMKSSELPGKLFGSAFVNHFVKTREWEWRRFSEAVTDWELKRYFEII